MNDTEPNLDLIFAAMSDATRRDILRRLVHRDRTIATLAEAYPISLAAVSKHMTILQKAGLVEITRQGRSRVVALSFEAIANAQIWLETIDDASLSLEDLEREIEALDRESDVS